MQHVMIDIETLGLTPRAAILSIGAVKFDPEANTVGDKFYCPITISSNMEMERTIDAGTLEWWTAPEQREAWDAWHSAEKEAVWTALDGFATWFGPDSLPTWGNGATFDNVLMLDALEQVGIARPWTYKHDRCYRTIIAATPAQDVERSGTYHNALDDALTQAHHLMRVTQLAGIALN